MTILLSLFLPGLLVVLGVWALAHTSVIPTKTNEARHIRRTTQEDMDILASSIPSALHVHFLYNQNTGCTEEEMIWGDGENLPFITEMVMSEFQVGDSFQGADVEVTTAMVEFGKGDCDDPGAAAATTTPTTMYSFPEFESETSSSAVSSPTSSSSSDRDSKSTFVFVGVTRQELSGYFFSGVVATPSSSAAAVQGPGTSVPPAAVITTPCMYVASSSVCDFASSRNITFSWTTPSFCENVTLLSPSGAAHVPLLPAPMVGYDCDHLNVWSALGMVTVGITILSALAAAVLLNWTFMHSDSNSLKKAQPLWCKVFLFGCGGASLGNLAWLGPNTTTMCNVRVWVFHLAATWVFGCVTLKGYRVRVLYGGGGGREDAGRRRNDATVDDQGQD